MIEAIFLDAGGVIIDESHFEPIKAEIITQILSQYATYTISDYWNDAEEAVFRFVSSVYEYVLFKHIHDLNEFKSALQLFKSKWNDLGVPFKVMPFLPELLERLSVKYRFGILGQYGNDFKSFLQCNNLLQYFSFQETQEAYLITKPDPRYFEAIVKSANCNPTNCIMVGDRIDKDITPANVLGMKTIRIKTGLHKNQEPRIPLEVPGLTIASLNEITDLAINKLGYCI